MYPSGSDTVQNLQKYAAVYVYKKNFRAKRHHIASFALRLAAGGTVRTTRGEKAWNSSERLTSRLKPEPPCNLWQSQRTCRKSAGTAAQAAEVLALKLAPACYCQLRIGMCVPRVQYSISRYFQLSYFGSNGMSSFLDSLKTLVAGGRLRHAPELTDFGLPSLMGADNVDHKCQERERSR